MDPLPTPFCDGRLGGSGASPLIARWPSCSIRRWSRLRVGGALVDPLLPSRPPEEDLDILEEVDEFWSWCRGENVDRVGWYRGFDGGYRGGVLAWNRVSHHFCHRRHITYPLPKRHQKKRQIVNLPLLSIRCHTDPKAQRYMTFFDQPFHATS